MKPLEEVGGVSDAFVCEPARKEKWDLHHQVVKPPSSQSFCIDPSSVYFVLSVVYLFHEPCIMAHLIAPSAWFRIVLAPLLYASDKSITWFSCSYLFFNHGKERNKLMSCVTIEMEIIRLNKDKKKRERRFTANSLL